MLYAMGGILVVFAQTHKTTLLSPMRKMEMINYLWFHDHGGLYTLNLQFPTQTWFKRLYYSVSCCRCTDGLLIALYSCLPSFKSLFFFAFLAYKWNDWCSCFCFFFVCPFFFRLIACFSKNIFPFKFYAFHVSK